MRILAVHVSHIDWKATRKTKFAEEIERREDGMDDCVVLFSCVEKLDEIDTLRVADGAAHEAIRRLDMLKVKKVVVFPFAHLTSNLSRPEVALQALLIDPVVNSSIAAAQLLDELWEINRPYIRPCI